jgi:hypothetical protein
MFYFNMLMGNNGRTLHIRGKFTNSHGDYAVCLIRLRYIELINLNKQAQLFRLLVNLDTKLRRGSSVWSKNMKIIRIFFFLVSCRYYYVSCAL